MITRALAHELIDTLFDRGEPTELCVDDGADIIVDESVRSGWLCRMKNGTRTVTFSVGGGAFEGVRMTRDGPSREITEADVRRLLESTQLLPPKETSL
jgi:hypothetical protein